MNAFFGDDENLYEKSVNMNCKNVQCMDNVTKNLNREELGNSLNCSAYNNRQIRNTDLERPMMFPEYRFKHLNYCTIHKLNGYAVCKDCKSCAYNKNVLIKDYDIKKIEN